ncbi:MAG: DUF4339 domain-containing protein [Thermoguttaceae bacterium]|nr:DUF4339 domain-containing protein [Thermoguttaceae bacterium]
MGIRFYCPQGHKLNVKAELAGKTGYCPECGARVQIPLQSTREPSHKHQPSSDPQPQESVPAADVPTLADEADHQMEVDTVGAPAAEVPTFADEAPAIVPPPVSPAVQAPQPEAPPAEWYLNSGDQQNYGPVSEEVMADWIKERRIGPTMLLWRQGWESWREARTVFPEIDAMFPPAAPAAVPPAEAGNVGVSDNRPGGDSAGSTPKFSLGQAALDEENELRRRRQRAEMQRKKQIRDIVLVIGLLAAIAFLSVVLVYVIRSQSTGKAEPTIIAQPVVSSPVMPADDTQEDEDFQDGAGEDDDF